jgi:hypothetical protein
LLFLAIAHWWSGVAALKYALVVVTLAQLFSIRVASQISQGLKGAGRTPLVGFGGAIAEL